MELLEIDLSSVLTEVVDTTRVDPVKSVIEQYAGMTADEIFSALFSHLLAFGLKFVGALIIFFAGRWLMQRFSRFIMHMLERRHVELSVQSFLGSFINIVFMLILVVLVIGIFGVNTTSFVALFASAGVAIGMALSGSLQNFAGGLMILVFKPYKVGDFIEAQGQSGTVKEIQIFNTVLITGDNRMIFVPNGNLSNNIIVNYSRAGIRRVEWTFGIGYGDRYETAKKVLAELLEADARILREPPYFIALHSLGDSSVNVLVRAWVSTENFWDVYYDLNRKVYKAFAENDVNIPYPQMDVHLIKD